MKCVSSNTEYKGFDMKKGNAKTKWILLLGVPLLALGLYTQYPKLGIISGYAAKNLASNLYLAGRTQDVQPVAAVCERPAAMLQERGFDRLAGDRAAFPDHNDECAELAVSLKKSCAAAATASFKSPLTCRPCRKKSDC